MPPHVRPYRAADRDPALEVCLAAFAPIYDGFRAALGPEIFAREHPDWRRGYAAFFDGVDPDDPVRRRLVAEAGGRLLGFASSVLHAERGMGELGLNAVHPQARRRGVARAADGAARRPQGARGGLRLCRDGRRRDLCGARLRPGDPRRPPLPAAVTPRAQRPRMARTYCWVSR
jgi:GNAT superfamily N-acetyltransferase